MLSIYTFYLKIGKRSSSNFSRVYLKSNGKKLRFKIELKKTLIKNFQHYLFINSFNIFEDLIVRHFYTQITKLFDVENPYCNWLLMGYGFLAFHSSTPGVLFASVEGVCSCMSLKVTTTILLVRVSAICYFTLCSKDKLLVVVYFLDLLQLTLQQI